MPETPATRSPLSPTRATRMLIDAAEAEARKAGEADGTTRGATVTFGPDEKATTAAKSKE